MSIQHMLHGRDQEVRAHNLIFTTITCMEMRLTPPHRCKIAVHGVSEMKPGHVCFICLRITGINRSPLLFYGITFVIY